MESISYDLIFQINALLDNTTACRLSLTDKLNSKLPIPCIVNYKTALQYPQRVTSVHHDTADVDLSIFPRLRKFSSTLSKFYQITILTYANLHTLELISEYPVEVNLSLPNCLSELTLSNIKLTKPVELSSTVERLNLSEVSGIDFSKSGCLKSLRLSNTKDVDCSIIEKLTDLQILCLEYPNTQEEIMIPISLKYLTTIGSASLNMSLCNGLKEIDVSTDQINSSVFPELEILRMNRISDMDELSRITTLKSLTITSKSIHVDFSMLTALTNLNVKNTVYHIPKSLIDLSCRSIGGGDYQSLRKLTVKSIKVGCNPILSGLEYLKIDTIYDDSIFKNIENLQELHIKREFLYLSTMNVIYLRKLRKLHIIGAIKNLELRRFEAISELYIEHLDGHNIKFRETVKHLHIKYLNCNITVPSHLESFTIDNTYGDVRCSKNTKISQSSNGNHKGRITYR